jgi:hypothetical protein
MISEQWRQMKFMCELPTSVQHQREGEKALCKTRIMMFSVENL